MQQTLSMVFFSGFCGKNGDATDSFNGFFFQVFVGKMVMQPTLSMVFFFRFLWEKW